MSKVIFVVEMLRDGDREQHSYIAGVYDDEILALTEAWDHMKFRANKYCTEIRGYEINGTEVYKRYLSCYGWDQFKQGSPILADTIEKNRKSEENE